MTRRPGQLRGGDRVLLVPHPWAYPRLPGVVVRCLRGRHNWRQYRVRLDDGREVRVGRWRLEEP